MSRASNVDFPATQVVDALYDCKSEVIGPGFFRFKAEIGNFQKSLLLSFRRANYLLLTVAGFTALTLRMSLNALCDW